jgi:hypothetical protein
MLQHLNDLCVLLPSSIPTLNMIETRVTANPTPQQKKKVEELSINIKSGRFSEAEDKPITDNWNKFGSVEFILNIPTLNRQQEKKKLNTKPTCPLFQNLVQMTTLHSSFTIFMIFSTKSLASETY